MTILKNIILTLLLLVTGLYAKADTIESFVNTLSEQENAVSWVQSKATVNITKAEAVVIVRNTYLLATEYGINPVTYLALLRAESGFNTRAVSRENARGLSQVIVKYHKDKLQGRSIHNPAVGVEMGIRILREYLDTSKNNLYAAMNKYSGGGRDWYFKNVKKFESDLKSHLATTKQTEPEVTLTLKTTPVIIVADNTLQE